MFVSQPTVTMQVKALEDELEELKTVKRKEVAEKIKVARGFGDLSENPGIEALVGRDEGHLKFVLREHLFSPCVLPRSPAPGCEG